jgi:hypothetical protein
VISLTRERERKDALDSAAIQARSHLEDLVRRYQVCWDVWPEEVMVDGKRRQIGYVIELAGTHPQVKEPSPGSQCCKEVFTALLWISEYVLPPECGQPSEYNIDPYKQRITYSRRRGLRPDVGLTIHMVHREGLGPVDECEQRCLDKMENRMTGLGVSKGGWRRRPIAS